MRATGRGGMANLPFTLGFSAGFFFILDLGTIEDGLVSSLALVLFFSGSNALSGVSGFSVSA